VCFANREKRIAGGSGLLQETCRIQPTTGRLAWASAAASPGLSDANSSNNRNETNSVSVSCSGTASTTMCRWAGISGGRSPTTLRNRTHGELSFNGAATQENQVVNGVPTPVAGTGSDFADFLLDCRTRARLPLATQTNIFANRFTIFTQRQFQVNPELSINAGLRWEYGAPVTETQGRLGEPGHCAGIHERTTCAGEQSSRPADGAKLSGGVGCGRTRVESRRRIGIAWRPISGRRCW